MVQVVAAASWLLRPERDETHGYGRRLLGRHPSQLEQDGDTGTVVLGPRGHGDCVQVRAEHDVGFGLVETRRVCDDVLRRPRLHGNPPRVAGRHRHGHRTDLVAE